ncbi:MAG: nucleotide exchange factor GrpE [Bacilli bacterium]|nr:nucleotide exchange factor GrpE [Bacilli bacterium]MDD4795058.1 nucleotide exchange factor GrpE [Bacilli bacterium]
MEDKEKEIKKAKVKKSKVSEEIISLKEELGLEKEKNLRVQAELVNYKRRRDEEVAGMFKYASEDIIISLLSVIDNFERAIKLDDNDLTDEISKFLAGFKMIYGNFIDILNKNEVKEIEADGLEFNPNFHQAVLTEKDENKPAGVVLEVLQKGYLYKEKVIRPAMVKVNE